MIRHLQRLERLITIIVDDLAHGRFVLWLRRELVVEIDDKRAATIENFPLETISQVSAKNSRLPRRDRGSSAATFS